eukprot:TRINITY_DN11542_c0_g1_i1.p1 TRINITY_DN11542_c0_g1~~TRINITY_DN11542_c0_g1_i1.p1  ORF type:complete len:871 (-),score=212.88 TRINITY_DN11542_c0_g1_i1:342-2954(-)
MDKEPVGGPALQGQAANGKEPGGSVAASNPYNALTDSAMACKAAEPMQQVEAEAQNTEGCMVVDAGHGDSLRLVGVACRFEEQFDADAAGGLGNDSHFAKAAPEAGQSGYDIENEPDTSTPDAYAPDFQEGVVDEPTGCKSGPRSPNRHAADDPENERSCSVDDGTKGHVQPERVAVSFCRNVSPGSQFSEALKSLVTDIAELDELDPMDSRLSTDSRKLGPRNTFIKVLPRDDELESLHEQSMRKCVRVFLRSPYFDSVIGLVIVADFLVICRDTDVQAAGNKQEKWVTYAMATFFFLYVTEWLSRLFAFRWKVFESQASNLDLTIICICVLEYILTLSTSNGSPPTLLLLRMIRLFRLLRLLRVMKLFSSLKELRKLLQMMRTCMKTLFWSFLLCFLVMCIWSVLAVELVNPVSQRLAYEGEWADCERCGRAFSTVMSANITFLQTVLAGDSWGLLALPILEDTPYTAIIFVGVLLTILFGVMQMITAVVVDTFADLRKNDVNSLVQEIDAEEVQEKKLLAKIFDKIDEDKSGAVSYDELEEGARRVNEFRNWLRVMDIDAQDLWQLFQIIDEDGSGEIDPDEFIDALYRMKNVESKTATKFVKHIVEGMEKRQADLVVKIESLESVLTEQVIQTTASDGHSSGSRGGSPRSPGKKRSVRGLLKKRSMSDEKGSAVAANIAEIERSGASGVEGAGSAALEDWACTSFEMGVRAKEEGIVKAVESAVQKATEVALEAAMRAAFAKTHEVLQVSMTNSAAIAHKAGESIKASTTKSLRETSGRRAGSKQSTAPHDGRKAEEANNELPCSEPGPTDILAMLQASKAKKRRALLLTPPASPTRGPTGPTRVIPTVKPTLPPGLPSEPDYLPP